MSDQYRIPDSVKARSAEAEADDYTIPDSVKKRVAEYTPPPPEPKKPGALERAGAAVKDWATRERPAGPGMGAAGGLADLMPKRAPVAPAAPAAPIPENTYQGAGVGGVLGDIRANEAARAQRIAPPNLDRPAGMAPATPQGLSPQEMFEGSMTPERVDQMRRQAAYLDRSNSPTMQPAPLEERIAQGVRDFTDNPVARGAVAGFSQLGQTGVGAVRGAADLVGADGVADFARGASGIASTIGQGATQDLGGNSKLVADVTSSIINSAPALAIGTIGGPALRTLFAQSAAADYAETGNIAHAGIMGAAEALGERFGFSEQLKLLKGVVKGMPEAELAKVLGALITKEIPGEQATAAMQFLGDKYGPGARNPNATFADYLTQAGETLKLTIAQTAVMGGGPAALVQTRNAQRQGDAAIERSATPMAQRAADAAGFIRPTEQRKQALDRLDDYAAEHGMPPKIVQAIKAKLDGVPLADLPGKIKRAVQALSQRGLFSGPADDGALSTLGGDSPAATPVEPTLDTPPVASTTPGGSTPADYSGLSEPTMLEEAAHQAATSPNNDLPEPTQAQKEAGNYKVGRTRIAGLDISIENPEGSVRRGVAPDGTPWETQMRAHYGYFRGTTANDGDKLDVFVKPGTPEDYSGAVFVVDQIDPATGKLDEHKVVLGASDEREAEAIYRSNYADDWQGFGAMTRLPMPAFKAWAKSGKLKQPLGDINAQPDVAMPPPVAAGAGDAGAPDADRSGGNLGPLSADAGGALVPAAAAPARSGAEAVSQGAGNQPDEALKPRLIANAGRTPNATEALTLQTNPDGTLTPHLGANPLVDYDSGEPIVLPAGTSDLDAKKAIRSAGAVSDKVKFFPATKEAAQAAADLDAGMADLGKLLGSNVTNPSNGTAAKAAGSEAQPEAAPDAPADYSGLSDPADTASLLGEPDAQAEPAAEQPEWAAFPPETGTKGIPRADMPQIKAEHRGAMVQFLKGRGIAHEQIEVPAADLKPTQAEFSPAKVEKAKAYEGGDRSILVSSDGHVLDGHHQWMAKRESGEPVKAIRLDAPISKLLDEVKEFPSAEVAAGAKSLVGDVPQAARQPAAAPAPAPAPAQPTEGPGSDAGNGFKQGPKKGERYRVGVVAAAGGAVSLEKRLPAGTAATFYVGKDGNLIDGDSVNFIGDGKDRLWIPATPEQAQKAQAIIDEMGRLELNDPARKDAKARLKALVQGKTTTGAPSNAADVARPGGVGGDEALSFADKYKALDPDARQERKQMLQDMIATRKERGESVGELSGRLAEAEAVDRGDTVDGSAVYSNVVLGHPSFDGSPFARNLVPMQVRSVADAERAIDRADKLYAEAMTAYRKAENELKIAKTPAAKNVAKKKLQQLANQAIDLDVLNDMREQTMPELQRLYKEAVKRFGESASDVSKTAPETNTSAEPVQPANTSLTDRIAAKKPKPLKERVDAKRKTTDAAPAREAFEHAGLKIYPGRVMVDGKPQERWAVQLPENKGTDKVLGDTLHATVEDAKKSAEYEVRRVESRAEQQRKDAAEKAERDAKVEANKGKSIKQRAADSVLDKPTKLPPQAGLGTGTRREAMDMALDQDRAVVEVMVEDTAAKSADRKTLENVSRAGYLLGLSNPNIPLVKEGLAARDRLKADKYEKPEYRVYGRRQAEGPFYTITKTEYDYATERKTAAQATPDQAPEAEGGNASTSTSVPAARTGAVEADGVATHKDPGEPAEPATAPVVAESLTKAARNVDRKPSEMKAELLGKIDAAIKDAPDYTEFQSVVKSMGEKDATTLFTTDGRGAMGDKSAPSGYSRPTRTFDIEGDGKFTVNNTVRQLLRFRRQVETSSGFSNTGQRGGFPKQTADSGSGSTNAAIANMIDEGDMQAAKDFAESQGIALADVKLTKVLRERLDKWERDTEMAAKVAEFEAKNKPEPKPQEPEPTPAPVAEKEAAPADGIASQTFGQWVRAAYAGNEYASSYLSEFNGDEKRAILGAAASTIDNDRTTSELLKAAKQVYRSKLFDLPRETAISLDIWDDADNTIKVELQRHFYDLDVRITKRDQAQYAAKAKAEAEKKAPYEAAFAEVSAEIKRLDALPGPITKKQNELSARRDRLREAIYQIGQGKEPDGRLLRAAPTEEAVEAPAAKTLRERVEAKKGDDGTKFSLTDTPESGKLPRYAEDTNPDHQRIAAELGKRISAGRPGFMLRAVAAPGDRSDLRAARAIARGIAGHTTIFVKQDGGRVFNGAAFGSNGHDYVLIDVDSSRPTMAVLGHEMLHRLRAARPDLYDRLNQRIGALLTNESAYADKLNARYDEVQLPRLSTGAIREELLADVFGDEWNDPTFWREMGQGQPSGFKAIVDAVMKYLDDLIQVIAKTRPFGTDEYLSDLKAARVAVIEATREFSAGEVGTNPDPASIKFSLANKTPEQRAAMGKAGIGGPPSIGQKVRAYYAKATGLVAAREEAFSALQQGALDQFTGIKRAVSATLGNLPAEQDPYVTARLANGGTSSVMRALLMHGQARWAANGQHLEKIDGTVGLLDILKPLGDDLNDWFGWMIGNRAARLMKEGRERNFTDADIKALQSLAVGKEAAFKKAAVEYAAFKRSVLDVAEAAGLINPESRRVWDNADYIPFYREVDGAGTFSATGRKGLAGQSSGVRVLKGGEAGLNDPMENLLMNFSRLIDASLKNNALLKTIHALDGGSFIVEKVGYDMTTAVLPAAQVKKRLLDHGTPQDILDVIPESAFDGMAKMWAIEAPKDPDVVRVMVGGKPQFYRINDGLLLKSLTSFVPFDFPGLGAMRAAKRVLTAAVTATPEFMIRNFIRDTVATRMIATDGVQLGSALRGIGKSYTEGGGYEHMLFAGASFQSGQVSAGDPTGTATAMRRALRNKGFRASLTDSGFMGTVLDSSAKLWERYRKVGEAIENANREAVFEAALKAGKSDTEAAFAAKDLMDFSLRGSSAAYQFFADVLPFFNARVQGLYRLGRADPKRLAAYGMAMLVMSSLLALANAGEDWYEELPDWDKDNYWHFKVAGQHLRIPKPFELGVIFATIPERIVRFLAGKDTGKKAAGRIFNSVSEQLAFDPMPQLFRPGVNVWANKDTFRDMPIENMADEGKVPSQRFSGSTSDTARVVAQAVPGVSDSIGMSPKRLEYLIGGYFGTAGLYALGLSDLAVRALEDKPVTPAWRADDIPVVKAFYRVDPARSTVFESDLYALHKTADELYRSYVAMARSGDPAAAAQFLADNREQIMARGALAAGVKGLSGLNKARDAIYADRTMTAEQKREAVDKLAERKAEVAKKVLNTKAVTAVR